MNTKYPNQTVRRGRTGSKSLSRILDKGESKNLTIPGAAPVNAVAAALTTALAGANNDMVFTAKTKGVLGNTITIRYVDPGVEAAAEIVTLVGKAITVTLRSVSGTLSTAAQVKTAIEANAAAHALIGCANSGADTGAGAVIALAATALTGGVDCTLGEAETFVYHGGYMHFTPTKTVITSTSWVRSQFVTY
jgi:hypothetical protein